MRVAEFGFELPEELIAQRPPAERGTSRMLVMDRATGRVEDRQFGDLPDRLRAGDLLILNDTRVLPGRLYGVRAGAGTQGGSPRPSGRIEVLLTRPHRGVRADGTGGEADGTGETDGTGQVGGSGDRADAIGQIGGSGDRADEVGGEWEALVRPGRKVRVGETLLFSAAERPEEVLLRAEVVGAGEFGERVLRFAPVRDFAGVLERIGHLPLPPYVRRMAGEPDTVEDRERYQTVYAQGESSKVQGEGSARSQDAAGGAWARSAAAPTAGLHFTEGMLGELRGRGVEIARLTLQVGLGTFQPVRVERTEEIRLHAERYTLPEATAKAIHRARAEGRRVIAVGTTVTRTLEHCALEAERAGRQGLTAGSGETSLFLSPGYRFRVVSGLLTNFHLPESTLLMLVSAFAGREAVLAAYAHAVRERYRFFSYGDCMLIT